MIPAHHHGRLDFAFRHQVVERQAKLVALAVAQPANSRRQTLKFDALLRQLDPASQMLDRKSTRLNSSHSQISYAVFCLKKKKKNTHSVLKSEAYTLATVAAGLPCWS